MIINHNISALNTHRQLNANNNAVSGSLEKLSSGLKINRAGDDAAGLAISEKMRGQIRGLEMASKNAQDGISLIQTAEGALNETHAILQRMRELAVQSANDTNTSEQDRLELQKEVDQLANALTDISKNTQFNEKDLLNGSFETEVLTFHVGANQGQNLTLNISDMSAEALKVNGFETEAGTATLDSEITISNETNKEVEVEYAALAGDDASAVTETTAAVDEDGKIIVTLKQAAGSSGSAGAVEATHDEVAAAINALGLEGVSAEVTGNSSTVTAAESATVAAQTVTDTVDPTKGIDISSQGAADKAITGIQSAIDNVSAERSKLGAVQNRLEHTINNLGASAENLTAAESRIRDVDMAKEMMDFTKNNILTQAAQAMLAQANQTPQGVLQLLR